MALTELPSIEHWQCAADVPLPFPLLLFFLFAFGENLVDLILPACIVRKAQTLAEYNGDPFVSSLVNFLTSLS